MKKKLNGLKKKSEKTNKRILDEIYSLYIRKSAADHQGYIFCYCGVRVLWQESDCSHYIPRRYLALRWDSRNTHPSCRRCNRFMGGNLQAYALSLEARYGEGILQKLDRDKQRIIKNYPYEEKIKEYKEKVSNI